jgi:hypothetical protein
LKCDISEAILLWLLLLFFSVDFLYPVKYFHISTWYLWILQYLRDYQTFVGTARSWTETFAKTSNIAWGRGKGKDVNSLFTFLSNPTIFSLRI